MTTTQATDIIPSESISRARAIEYLNNETDGLIFSCFFQKKDGTFRKMVCRRGVRKGVRGVGMNYDPASKGLICVYDMENKGFRMVNAKTLVQFIIHGRLFLIRD